MELKITERGWAGHFICADRCLFRRNTLIQGPTDAVIVSTVGNFSSNGKMDTIGAGGRYYETMAFGAEESGPYLDANVSDQRSFDAEWAICAESHADLPEDVDNKANEMHEAVVREFVAKLGAIRDTPEDAS